MKFKRKENYNIALKRLGIKKVIFGGDLSVLTEKELIDMNAELDKQYKEQKKIELTAQRNAELKEIVIDNILCDKESISAMNIKYSTMKDADVVEWITIDNDFVSLTKAQLLELITKATKVTGEIHIKYRSLKNAL